MSGSCRQFTKDTSIEEKIGSIRIFSFKGGVSRDIDEKLEAETRDFLYDVVQGQHDGFENDAGGSGRYATRTVWI